MKLLMVTAMMLMMSNLYAAGTSPDATINSIGVGKRYSAADVCNGKACVLINITPTPIGAPSCARHSSGWHFLIDTSVDTGKQAYAAVLTAKTTGRSFFIAGTGTCIGNGFEEVNYIILN